jgi:hypothetical protein
MHPTRREFLAVAVAAPVVSPILLHTQDKSGTRSPVMGSSAHRYEAAHDWGVLPPSLRFGNTHAVAEDSQGNIHVHHTVHASSDRADTVVVFDADGRFVRSWGPEFRGVAHGMEIRREGRDEFLYLTVNTANPKMTPRPALHGVVVKTTLKGEIVWKIEGPPDVEAYKPGPDGTPPRYNPTNVAIAPNGDLYVGDGYGSFYINQYNAKGEYIRTFGGRGAGPGQLDEPHGIWVDARTSPAVLVVADRRNHRLQRFTLDGRHIDFVEGFRLPCHFHEHDGMVVVPDLHGRVTLLDRKNAIVAHLGDSNAADWNNPLRREPREKFIPGQFICPHGACFDHDGNIYVAEWVEVGRVTKLRRVA